MTRTRKLLLVFIKVKGRILHMYLSIVVVLNSHTKFACRVLTVVGKRLQKYTHSRIDDNVVEDEETSHSRRNVGNAYKEQIGSSLHVDFCQLCKAGQSHSVSFTKRIQMNCSYKQTHNNIKLE